MRCGAALQVTSASYVDELACVLLFHAGPPATLRASVLFLLEGVACCTVHADVEGLHSDRQGGMLCAACCSGGSAQASVSLSTIGQNHGLQNRGRLRMLPTLRVL